MKTFQMVCRAVALAMCIAGCGDDADVGTASSDMTDPTVISEASGDTSDPTVSSEASDDTTDSTVSNEASADMAAPTVSSDVSSDVAASSAPTVFSSTPIAAASDVAINQQITAIFNVAMDPATCTTTTFTVQQGEAMVPGTVTCVNNTATFAPTSNLEANTEYAATMTTGMTSLAGYALAANVAWSFTTGAAAAAGPAPVALGTSSPFAMLTKSGITDVPSSMITGDIGASPITGAAIGVSCPEVTGTIYSVDAAGPACKITDATFLTTAIGDMEIAFTDAAGRTLPDFTELGAGEIGGLTIVPGLYKWSSNVLISTDVTLSGDAQDVWIFQIAGDLTQANATQVTLAGGAQAKNIFWQVSGGTGVALGTTAHCEGTILALKGINLGTGASINGRLLSQTAVALDQNTVVVPSN